MWLWLFVIVVCVVVPVPAVCDLDASLVVPWLDPVALIIFSNSSTVSLPFVLQSYGTAIISPQDPLNQQGDWQPWHNTTLVASFPDITGCTLRSNSTTRDGSSYSGKTIILQRSSSTCSPAQACWLAQQAGVIHCLFFQTGKTRYPAVGLTTVGQTVNVPVTMVNTEHITPILTYLNTNNNPSQQLTISFPTTGPIDPIEWDVLRSIAPNFGAPPSPTYPRYYGNGRHPSDLLSSDPVIAKKDPCVERIMGVVCMGNPGHIIHIFWYGAYMEHPPSGELADTWNNLTQLTKIEMYSTQVTGNIPSTLLQIPRKYIDISSNQFNHIMIQTWNNNNNNNNSSCQLEYINLGFNTLTSITDSINACGNLRWLLLNSNKLTGPMFSLSGLISLTNLDISTNQLTGDVPSFQQSTSLTALALGANRFTGLSSVHVLDGLKQLTSLSLTGNKINAPFPTLINTTKLVTLDLSYNQFYGPPPLTWNLPAVTTFSVTHNRMTSPLTSLYTMTRVVSIDCSYNLITTPPGMLTASYLFSSFGPSVTTLNFAHNLISGDLTGGGTLGSLSNLQYLYLSYNQLSTVYNIYSNAETVSKQIIVVDFSYNNLTGSMDDTTPKATLQKIDFTGNPNFKSPNNRVPTWAVPTMTSLAVSPDGITLCPSTIFGSNVNRFTQLVVDPSYYGYFLCSCQRGYYDTPQSIGGCKLIPNSVYSYDPSHVMTPTSNINVNKYNYSQVDATAVLVSPQLTDTVYGSQRLSTGQDTTWYVGQTSSTGLSRVLTIYITIYLNRAYFNDDTDTIGIYQGMDESGERVLFAHGMDVTIGKTGNDMGNIMIGNQSYHGIEIAVNAGAATIRFVTRDLSGTHFLLNHTLSSECQANYYLASPQDQQCTLIIPTYQVQQGVQIVVYAVTGVVALLILMVATIITWKRHSVVIRTSSFPFVSVILFCLLTLSISSIFYAMQPSSYPSVCHIRPWLTSFSMVGLLSALLVKANRVRMIFQNTQLTADLQVKNTALAKWMIVMLTVDVVLLIILSAYPLTQPITVMGSGSTSGYQVIQCASIHDQGVSNGFIAWLTIQLVYIGAFLFVGTYIAWGMRNVPCAYNESFHIASGLLCLSILCMLLIPLNFIVNDSPNALMVIRGIGSNLVALCLCVCLFGPKLYYIYLGLENESGLARATTFDINAHKQQRAAAHKFNKQAKQLMTLLEQLQQCDPSGSGTETGTSTGTGTGMFVPVPVPVPGSSLTKDRLRQDINQLAHKMFADSKDNSRADDKDRDRDRDRAAKHEHGVNNGSQAAGGSYVSGLVSRGAGRRHSQRRAPTAGAGAGTVGLVLSDVSRKDSVSSQHSLSKPFGTDTGTQHAPLREQRSMRSSISIGFANNNNSNNNNNNLAVTNSPSNGTGTETGTGTELHERDGSPSATVTANNNNTLNRI